MRLILTVRRAMSGTASVNLLCKNDSDCGRVVAVNVGQQRAAFDVACYVSVRLSFGKSKALFEIQNFK
jgi:hypothetical protein